MDNSNFNQYVKDLTNNDLEVRLSSLKKLKQLVEKGEIEEPDKNQKRVNNHIHTTYSFSPYYPAGAVWNAYKAGLTTAGIMDHDSIKGAREFIKAGEIIDIATTIGMECRVDFSETRLKKKRLNHPDQISTAYMALHGVSHTEIDTVQDFFVPYRKERNKRNQKMVDRLNQFFQSYGININFEKDVVPLSEWDEEGSITERHLLFAVSRKLVEKYGKGEKLLSRLREDFEDVISDKIEKYLLDADNENYEYDLLGLLKKDTSYFYIEATTECPDVREIIELANEVSAISAYAYLGDVKSSVTGDKKAQKFEDDYLELLFDVLKEIGFDAVTYMPTRNTMDQLTRLKSLCEEYNFFQISGEDINSPRQSFICEALKKDEFSNLIDATWALIGHEKAATKDLSNGMFTLETKEKYPELEERIEVYQKIGKGEE